MRSHRIWNGRRRFAVCGRSFGGAMPDDPLSGFERYRPTATFQTLHYCFHLFSFLQFCKDGTPNGFSGTRPFARRKGGRARTRIDETRGMSFAEEAHRFFARSRRFRRVGMMAEKSFSYFHFIRS
jgi:hypothetical protein